MGECERKSIQYEGYAANAHKSLEWNHGDANKIDEIGEAHIILNHSHKAQNQAWHIKHLYQRNKKLETKS